MTTNRLWILGSAVLVVVILVLGYLVGVSPRLAEAAADAQEQAQVESQNAAQSASVAQLKAEFDKLDAVRQQLAGLQLAVPSDPSGTLFVDTLYIAAAESGVFLQDATLSEATIFSGTAPAKPGGAAAPAPAPTSTPSPASTGAPTTPAAGSTTTATGPVAGQAYVIPVVINIQGPPTKVFAFIKLMQTGPRFFINSKVTFQSEGASASGVSGGSSGTSGSSGGSAGGSATPKATLTGYLFVVAGTNALPTTPTPTPTNTPAPTSTSTPPPTNSPDPTSTSAP